MTNHRTAEIAGLVRAEFARQRKTYGEAARVLDTTAHTVGRRMSGDVPFSVAELVILADWLAVPVDTFLAPILRRGRAAS